MDSNDDQEQMFEGISEIRGGLSKGHVGHLNNKIFKKSNTFEFIMDRTYNVENMT